ncbi:MAG TPA: hypothetical protein VHN77_14495 [Phycisphaerales bacterium]|nr:hypothetical protein [Phycisphaerales bacterium]
MTTIRDIVTDFALALKEVDATAPREDKKAFRPGIGPLTEAFGTRLALEYMSNRQADRYVGAKPERYPGQRTTCDAVFGDWAVEFKLLRPFGDNGKPAENWIENALYPYPGNVSALGDLFKLSTHKLRPRSGVVLYGFEHVTAITPLEPAVRSFELIAAEVLRFQLGARCSHRIEGLVHPVHQVLVVHGWELLATE